MYLGIENELFGETAAVSLALDPGAATSNELEPAATIAISTTLLQLEPATPIAISTTSME